MRSDHDPPGHLASVSIGKHLGTAFEQMEERIRQRAYELFKHRSIDEGDAMTDWLNAQSELLAPIDLVVNERKHHVQVEGNLKGFKPTEVEVEVGAGELRVCGAHRESTRSKKRGVTSSSCQAHHFFQAVPLPCEVNIDKSHARLLKNGKLSIKLPKKRHESAKEGPRAVPASPDP